jgi:hypothetical protein
VSRVDWAPQEDLSWPRSYEVKTGSYKSECENWGYQIQVRVRFWEGSAGKVTGKAEIYGGFRLTGERSVAFAVRHCCEGLAEEVKLERSVSSLWLRTRQMST